MHDSATRTHRHPQAPRRDGPDLLYLLDVRRHDLLTPTSERELARTVRSAILTEVEEMCRYSEVVQALIARKVATAEEKSALVSALASANADGATDTGRISRHIYDRLGGLDCAGMTLRILRERFAELVSSSSANTSYHQQLTTSTKFIDQTRSQAEPSRAKLASCNLRLVLSIAREFMGLGVLFEDLVGAGNLGLLRGIDGFNPEKGYRLSTYVTNWIKQGISREIQNNADIIRLPVHVHSAVDHYRVVVAELTSANERDPSPEEIAEALSLSIKGFEILRIHSDARQSGLTEVTPYMRDTRSTPADKSVIKQGAEAMHEYLNRVLPAVLETKTAQVFMERTVDPTRESRCHLPTKVRTNEAIGQSLRLSRERVRQLNLTGVSVARDLIYLRKFSVGEINAAVSRAKLTTAQSELLDKVIATFNGDAGFSDAGSTKVEDNDLSQQLSVRKRAETLQALVSMLMIQRLNEFRRAAVLKDSLPPNLAKALTLVTGEDEPRATSIILREINAPIKDRKFKPEASLRETIQSALRRLRPALESFDFE